jgi:branched-chain amino acid transport system substrate-binding protein
MAQWAHKNGVKKVVVMVADFAPGHDAESSFSKTFTDLGGTVTSTIRVPLRSPEFSSYMQRIKDAKADAVFVFLPLGELCVQFLKAYSDSGLATSGLKLLGTADITDESHLDATGDTAVGAITSGVYSPALDNPANKKLVEEYERAFGKTQRVSLVNAMIWDSLQVVYAGLEAQRGAAFNPDKFVATLRGRKFDSPRGPFTLDKDNGDIIQNVYIRRVERRNGLLQNVTLETFRDVPTK